MNLVHELESYSGDPENLVASRKCPTSRTSRNKVADDVHPEQAASQDPQALNHPAPPPLHQAKALICAHQCLNVSNTVPHSNKKTRKMKGRSRTLQKKTTTEKMRQQINLVHSLSFKNGHHHCYNDHAPPSPQNTALQQWILCLRHQDLPILSLPLNLYQLSKRLLPLQDNRYRHQRRIQLWDLTRRISQRLLMESCRLQICIRDRITRLIIPTRCTPREHL